jgi:tetratricopeptide (TPR) repeat protein/CHAT domain-containing protein
MEYVVTPFSSPDTLSPKGFRNDEVLIMYRISLALLVLASFLLGGGPSTSTTYSKSSEAQIDQFRLVFDQCRTLSKQARYDDAAPLCVAALKLGELLYGPENKNITVLLSKVARAREEQGRYAEAEVLYKRSLAVAEKALGLHHPRVATGLIDLALLYKSIGRYSEAEALFKRSLVIREKELGRDHPDIVGIFNTLAGLYGTLGRYAEAEPLYKRSLTIFEKAVGHDHPKVAIILNNLAGLYETLGRYSEAEPLYKRTLAIFEKTVGRDHPKVATILNNLAVLYNEQGRYTEAESFTKRSLAIREKVLGPDHPKTVTNLSNLANVYMAQGRYAEAQPLYERSLAIKEKALGLDHPGIAITLNNLAGLYETLGRYSEAEPLYKRSLVINETALGLDHPSVATNLSNLATVYLGQGRYAEAEPLYERSLAIREKALGLNHISVISSLNNLAELYKAQGRYTEAESLYKRSEAVTEKALGIDHPDMATVLNNLGGLYYKQGRYAEVKPLLERSLAIKEKALGLDHLGIGITLNNLAGLYETLGRYSEAEPLYKRSLVINETALGLDHPNIATIHKNLAGTYKDNGQAILALDHIRKASAIHRDRRVSTGGNSGKNLSEQKIVRKYFIRHVRYAMAVAENEPSKGTALIAESFEAGQLATATSTAAAIAGMGARFAAGNGRLSNIVRSRQDAAGALQRLDEKLVSSLGMPPDERDERAEAQLRIELAGLRSELDALDGQLNVQFPDYTELVAPQPAALLEIQGLLASGEAMLSYMVDKENTYLWVVRRDSARLFKLVIGQAALEKLVKDLRDGLDPTGVTSLSNLPPFDTAKAYQLYVSIFAAAEPLLDGIQHLFVVPDGPLQSLPLGVLVSRETKGNFTDLSGYRQVPWLAKKYALTTLPSASSLRTLRRFAKAARADKPFAGVGDPLLQGHPGDNRGVKLSNLFTSRGIADVNAVRTMLAPLPETADELEAMSRILGGGEADLFLRKRATESRIKTEDLSKYQVIAFATHGLVAGELEGLAEPALVLTPPRIGTEQDDGLLTASEVATLKMNADMVVLSACSTASADGTPDAEALSGLAKAFFYAGSRSLLVSHWAVDSDAAVLLTTKMLKEVANDNSVGRAEGLRRSMLALMEDNNNPHFSHPMFWAPFVVVGEGGVHKVK